MPKVSFVLPAYKRRFLKEAIASILAQTYVDFELIVVDDCSPEDLRAVVGEFHDTRMAYHRNENNIGGDDLVAAWNHAMTFATGEWCVLASDDDVYHPEFLAEMVRLTEKYPHVNLVHCRNCGIDGDGKVFEIGAPRSEYESGLQMLYTSSVLNIRQHIADLMFRRTSYAEMRGFPNYKLGWYADIAFAIHLAWRHGAVCSDKILFFFRDSGVNLSTRGIRVEQKIEAGLQFLNSVKELIGSVNEKDIEGTERVLLPLCVPGVTCRVEELIRYELTGLPFFRFLRVLNKSCLPKMLKRRMLKYRIGGWLNLRRFLPGWRDYRI